MIFPTVKIKVNDEYYVIQSNTDHLNCMYDSTKKPKLTGIKVFHTEWSNIALGFIICFGNSINEELAEDILKELNLPCNKLNDERFFGLTYVIPIENYIKLIEQIDAIYALNKDKL